ncbi:hypothetical protein AB4K20DRAFT_1981991 [Rhizopus microsporus]|uniref:Uncharacterized protein n=1 Tax=Rhizopus microsporus TaxID=58291 RepID=A0A1X0RTU7_RHIZD|nr:hypothetical protein BCV71DRAFT_237665 [Rhizopus microsporus]
MKDDDRVFLAEISALIKTSNNSSKYDQLFEIRCLVESVYISPTNLAKSPSASRDMDNTNKELLKMGLDNYADSTQTTGGYEVYRRTDILQTPDCLESFDCRSGIST